MTVAAVIASITLRQLLSRRRTLLMLLLGAVLVVLAIVFRLGDEASSEADAISWTMGMLEYLGLVTVVPLIALIFGTGAIGSEIEDGTAVHLLTKPVPRWKIGLVKFGVAAVCAALLAGIPMLVAGLIGSGDAGVAIGYGVAGVIGAVIYVAIFLALSLFTSRAFVIGLGYILIWEGLLAGLFPGIGTLSVRWQSTAFAQALTDALNATLSDLDRGPPLANAIVAAVLMGGVALVLALRRLRRLEIAGETG
jgi:ABC-2 type transport system permease protein